MIGPSSCAPTAQLIRIDGGEEVLSEHDFDAEEVVLFNQSLEGLALNAVERAAMRRMGLDPNNSDDYALLAFIVRGFHVRYQAVSRGGKASPEVGVYLYNLDGVPTGQPIPILDASALEGVSAEAVGPVLRTLFDPIRTNGTPRALVAVASDRSGEELWRRVLITAFAERVTFATSGTVVITAMCDGDGLPVHRLQLPAPRLGSLLFEVEGRREGRRWWLTPHAVPLTVSGP